jgi:hypothetical protein
VNDDPVELPLHGGRTTPGVVRIGTTVRRPPGPNAEAVRRFLRYLVARGFGGVPAFLGTDARGRDIFAWVEGEVPADLGFHSDDALRDAARLVRRFHDLGADFVEASGLGTAGAVMCHNDLSPCNFVFRDGLPVAIIDLDAMAPGPRTRDLGYAAWLWLDIGSPDIDAAEQARRLGVFLDAYGLGDRLGVLAAMVERQAELAAEGRRTGNAAMADWAAACHVWTRSNLRVLGAVPSA